MPTPPPGRSTTPRLWRKARGMRLSSASEATVTGLPSARAWCRPLDDGRDRSLLLVSASGVIVVGTLFCSGRLTTRWSARPVLRRGRGANPGRCRFTSGGAAGRLLLPGDEAGDHVRVPPLNAAAPPRRRGEPAALDPGAQGPLVDAQRVQDVL